MLMMPTDSKGMVLAVLLGRDGPPMDSESAAAPQYGLAKSGGAVGSTTDTAVPVVAAATAAAVVIVVGVTAA